MDTTNENDLTWINLSRALVVVFLKIEFMNNFSF